MHILVIILLGALVGWLASILTKRDERQGWLANVLVGIVGAIIGNPISSILGEGHQAGLGFDLSGLLWSLGGAVILCLVLNYFDHPGTPRGTRLP